MDTMNINPKQTPTYKLMLMLTALGVVFGDIGTSPLYALKEAFHHGHLQVNETNIFGLLSLVFWSLIIVISIKYVGFVLRANFHGEGGILALASIIKTNADHNSKFIKKEYLILLGVFGAAFLYGDGIITPAISILSAVEGLQVITPVFNPYILPITIGILIALFSVQRFGTALVGRFFGPVMLIWFLTIAVLGVSHIIDNPSVFKSMNPYYAIDFFRQNGFIGFAILGSVFLAVTGGEALYSDMGHFGIEPIKKSWFFLVLPCLLLNYFGQGVNLLNNPEAVENPFFMLAPSWAMYPLVIIATLATTIASQALITGVFSITMQAIQQGFLPRMHIQHTSEDERGQIYMKDINFLLMLGCIFLVLEFRTSSALAAAYGIAVTATMIITTILFYFVAVYKWHWNRIATLALCTFFGIIDLGFLGSNLLKFFHGGWLPLVVGAFGFAYMTTWADGRRILYGILNKKNRNLQEFFEEIDQKGQRKIEGTGVYMTKLIDRTPYPLLKTFEHFHGVHKNILFLHVETKMIPYVDPSRRFHVEQIRKDVFFITLRFGYMERHNVPAALKNHASEIAVTDFDRLSFFIGRENIFATEMPGMALWREKIFAHQTRNETPATQYFDLPQDRVLEIGSQVAI